MIKGKVNIRPLKDFASEILPKDWVLKHILLTELDQLDGSEFCAKVDLWLKLARGKTRENSGGS